MRGRGDIYDLSNNYTVQPLPSPPRAAEGGPTLGGQSSMTKLAARIQTIVAVREKGATAVEYGLMVALIAAVIIAGVTLIGTNSGNTFNNVATAI